MVGLGRTKVLPVQLGVVLVATPLTACSTVAVTDAMAHLQTIVATSRFLDFLVGLDGVNRLLAVTGRVVRLVAKDALLLLIRPRGGCPRVTIAGARLSSVGWTGTTVLDGEIGSGRSSFLTTSFLLSLPMDQLIRLRLFPIQRCL